EGRFKHRKTRRIGVAATPMQRGPNPACSRVRPIGIDALRWPDQGAAALAPLVTASRDAIAPVAGQAARASVFCVAGWRLTALRMARKEAVTMSSWMPTPNPVGELPTRTST